ncbi:radical sam [Lucifera butyrica]|uniref:Radical sam n=2 Tax=Lucifera butyrica TaxID=1351585 RepID=A0A498R2C0_9FIRM|nr:radical sam [Lucifera butyrica]
MQQKKALLFNIQKFSIHDGPGIRTAVFFKGCPLKCNWCSNPESQMGKIQIAWDAAKCIGCKKCVKGCPEGAISEGENRILIDNEKCKGWQECMKGCPANCFQVEGEYKAVDEIVAAVLKDRDFYEESGGGVTLTGGEVLQQADVAMELLKELKKHTIHRAVETTGYTTSEVFERFLAQVDLVLFDLKHYDTVKHKEGTGVDNAIILENMKLTVQKGKQIIARIPVIPKFNDSLQDAAGFCRLLMDVGIKEVNLLPFHQFGQKKYELLGMKYKLNNVKPLHPEDLQDYQKVFLGNGLDCKF